MTSDRVRRVRRVRRVQELRRSNAATPRPSGRVYRRKPIRRQSIEEALENDRWGICGSEDHFREDHPED